MINRLIKLTISLLYYVILILFNTKKKATIVVLTYHSVKPLQRAKFRRQMERLICAGDPVFADELSSLTPGKHHIAVTFDDGFYSFVENAFAALRDMQIPVTLFAPSGLLGEAPRWINNPDHENAQERVMSIEQLRSLPDSLVHIGSHCVTHPRLTLLTENEAWEEISASKNDLEHISGKTVTTLAFPFDNYNEASVELAKKAGYTHVFKDIPSFPATDTESFLLGRIDVSPDDWSLEYKLKICGAYQWLPFAVRLKQIIIRASNPRRQHDA